jgi:sugar phosphate permease
MTGGPPTLALTVATMLLLVVVLGLFQGDGAPVACSLCGSRWLACRSSPTTRRFGATMR